MRQLCAMYIHTYVRWPVYQVASCVLCTLAGLSSCKLCARLTRIWTGRFDKLCTSWKVNVGKDMIIIVIIETGGNPHLMA